MAPQLLTAKRQELMKTMATLHNKLLTVPQEQFPLIRRKLQEIEMIISVSQCAPEAQRTVQMAFLKIIEDHSGEDILSKPDALQLRIEADLNLDSLDRVEIIMACEEEFGIEIDDAAAEALVANKQDPTLDTCLQGLIALIQRQDDQDAKREPVT